MNAALIQQAHEWGPILLGLLCHTAQESHKRSFAKEPCTRNLQKVICKRALHKKPTKGLLQKSPAQETYKRSFAKEPCTNCRYGARVLAIYSSLKICEWGPILLGLLCHKAQEATPSTLPKLLGLLQKKPTKGLLHKSPAQIVYGTRVLAI